MTDEIAPTASDDGIPFTTFLVSHPPGKARLVTHAVKWQANSVRGTASIPLPAQPSLDTPPVRLYCTHTICSREQVFRCESHTATGQLDTKPVTFDFFMSYRCGNCRAIAKTFALRITHSGQRVSEATIEKFGELPPFGLPPTPPRLLTILEDQKDNFLAGRRSESQGLGIGAFAYYRRVVEHQKTRIIDEIIKAAKKLDAHPDIVERLSLARAQDQFTKSVEMIKDAIPESLMIDGHHNPLKLLHAALSAGLHRQELPDSKCLELAQSIRLVLAELADRLSLALKRDNELSDAIARLQSITSSSTTKEAPKDTEPKA